MANPNPTPGTDARLCGIYLGNGRRHRAADAHDLGKSIEESLKIARDLLQQDTLRITAIPDGVSVMIMK